MLHQILISAFLLLFIAETIRSEKERLYGTSTTADMEMDKLIFPGLLNITRVYSPLLFNLQWSSLACLTTMIVLSIYGSTLNGYFLTALMVETDLKYVENVFLWCVGLSDAFITMGVAPVTTFVMMSQTKDINPSCHVMQMTVTASTYGYTFFFTLVAGLTYLQVCHGVDVKGKAWKVAISFVAIVVFAVSFILAAVGTYCSLDYDYCERRHFGSYYFRLTTTVIQAICFILTMFAKIGTFNHIRVENRAAFQWRRTTRIHGDVITLFKANTIAYVLFVAFWTPYLTVVNFSPYTCDALYYVFAWIGVVRSVLTSTIYGFLSRAFRRAYRNIFDYCWCKTSLYNYYPRHARDYNFARRGAVPEVRTHIMQNAVHPNSSQRVSTEETEL